MRLGSETDARGRGESAEVHSIGRVCSTCPGVHTSATPKNSVHRDQNRAQHGDTSMTTAIDRIELTLGNLSIARTPVEPEVPKPIREVPMIVPANGLDALVESRRVRCSLSVAPSPVLAVAAPLAAGPPMSLRAAPVPEIRTSGTQGRVTQASQHQTRAFTECLQTEGLRSHSLRASTLPTGNGGATSSRIYSTRSPHRTPYLAAR